MLVNQILAMKADAAGRLVGAPVATIRPGATVADAARSMATLRIGALVVSADDTRPEGILSERDIVRELGQRGAAVLDERVSALMTAPIMTCRTGDDALAVLERMTAGRFRHMPVVDEDGGMVGLVSIGDAVSGRLKELSAEKEALTGMIMGA